ncbi:beta strand repeat-containing protein [Rhodococcus kronopolitis]|uniref:Beta strand repeat-containing protein n=1 Tax=Rhodococcus kronopolitis TaxID=1460226 RepID=A0ABV9FXL2_9NOCA
MSRSNVRRVAVPVTSAAVVAGMMLVGSPAGAAPTTTSYKNSCQASAVLTVHKVADTSMTVDAPATVAPGETFTYRIQPGGASYPNSESGATTTNVSRLKVDYEIPANSTFVSAAVVGTGTNLDGAAPSVLRVDDTGNANGSGNVLRLSGSNQTIANGPSSSTNSEGGIRAPKLKKDLNGNGTSGDSWFRLPAVDVTVVAGAPGVITPKVRTAGNAGNYNNDMNYYSFLPRATFLGGTQWAPTRCTPRDAQGSALNAGAGPLATITVSDPGPVIVDTTTTLNVPGTAKTGTAVDLTATVAPAGATGTVQFKDGTNNIGGAVPVNNGTATLNHTFTTNGAHNITAVYSGDATNRTSTSAASNVQVTTDPVIVDTTTTLNVPATAKTGTAVDLTATVAPAGATGTVQFKDGTNNIGGAIAVNNGTATLNHTFTTTGAHSITAVYSGDATNRPSTSAASAVDVSVNVVDTTTTLNVPGTAKTGTAVDLTATVAPAGATGTVQFKDGTDNIGGAIAVNNGTATLNHTFTANGAHSITAVYSGAEGFATSTSAAGTVDVSTDPVIVDTTTTLNVPGTAKTGTAVDLTATVAPSDATGTVQFKDGTDNIGGAIAVNNGTATLNHTFTANGAHSITAVYSGDATNRTSTSAASTVDVSTDPVIVDTTTTLNVPGTAKTGTAVDLTATVAPSDATGTVQFKDGTDNMGGAIAVNNGTATLNHTFTTDGTHNITAVYSGDATNRTSTSAAANVEVSTDVVVADTTTTMNVPGEATTGDQVQLFALVKDGDNNPAVGGTVQFTINGSNVGGAISLVDGGAKLDHTFAASGAYNVGAVYSGSATFHGSTAQASSVNVTDPAPVELDTVTTLTAPATATKGDAVNLSATVKTQAGDAVTTGTVTFMDGATALGTAVDVVDGQATLSHAFALTGDRHITAVYSGASGMKESTSAASTVTVSGGGTNPGGTGSLGQLGSIFGS